VERQTFTPDEIRELFDHAGVQMRAMILLGLNCGFGCTDCAELRWDHLNLDESRVNFPRGKTGVQRNFTLWRETVEALRAVPVRGDLVFYTRQGHPWVRQTTGKSPDSPLSKEFFKLMRKAKIATRKGTGFYSLRRTAATIAAETGDVFAVQGILGHADLKMASTYVQNTTPQTDRAINHTHEWLNQKLKDQDTSE
jgi:integrase